MQKWLEQQGVKAPSGMGEVMSPPVPPANPVKASGVGYDGDAGSVDSMEQNVGRDEVSFSAVVRSPRQSLISNAHG